MTRNDLIYLAWDAGALVSPGISTTDLTFSPATLERFANLVATRAAAAEREACVLVCESRGTPGTGSVEILDGAANAIRARSQL